MADRLAIWQDGPWCIDHCRETDCRLMVLEDTAEKIVIGCRAELGK